MKNLMKFLKKQFALLAFVLAIGAAFAFNLPTEEAVTTTYWFDYNGTVIGSYMGTDPSSSCPRTEGDECALGFDVNQVIIDGEDVYLHPDATEEDAVDEAFKDV